jgi:hypothetical protein
MQPKKEDLLDAIEHANHYGEDWSLKDFTLKFEGMYDIEDLYEFDDLSAWLETEEDDEESLEDFRGEAWAMMAKRWGKNIPPIVVITAPSEGSLYTRIGDGRGRINYANVYGYKLPVWHLIWKHSKVDEGIIQIENGKMKTLRETFFKEKAKSPKDARSYGKALYIRKNPDRINIVLYDVYQLFLEIQKRPEMVREGSFHNSDFIIGIINLNKEKRNYYSIQTSAAEKKWGPLMYDIAFSYTKGYIGSDSTVSDSAKGVWDFFFNKRQNEFDRKYRGKGDGINNWDEDYEDLKDNPLAYVYKIKNPKNIKTLLDRHQKFMKEIKKEFGIPRKTAEYALYAIGGDYFDKKYDS